MNWQRAVGDTVTALGYDLVDADKSAGGLLRVFIDHLPMAAGSSGVDLFITVDDCEKVTRQLQHVLEVEGCAYERLEVSSPGLDRPLKKVADFARFIGEQVELTLKVPFQGRRKFRGELHPIGDPPASAWRLVLPDESAATTRAMRRAADKTTAAPANAADQTQRALDFSLDEVREARLVPVVDFKGCRFVGPSEVALPAESGSDNEIDGGRIR